MPSQVVLTSTLQRTKGLRSVCNKLLMQMMAKMGGEPWVCSNMPFASEPTMVCGIDVFHKAGKFSVLGFAASVSRNFSKFVSVEQSHLLEQEEIGSRLRSAM